MCREGLQVTVIDAGAVRFRPMMLTAAAVVVGASVILFDPIFQGLAISLMAGEVASLLFSRMTVPILYFLLIKRAYRSKEHKGGMSLALDGCRRLVVDLVAIIQIWNIPGSK